MKKPIDDALSIAYGGLLFVILMGFLCLFGAALLDVWVPSDSDRGGFAGKFIFTVTSVSIVGYLLFQLDKSLTEKSDN